MNYRVFVTTLCWPNQYPFMMYLHLYVTCNVRAYRNALQSNHNGTVEQLYCMQTYATHTHTHARTPTHTHTNTHTRTHTRTHAHTHTHTHAHTHQHTHAYTHMHTHTRAHTHTDSPAKNLVLRYTPYMHTE